MSQFTPSVPDKATVLVIGGGPGGSYTATCLAREGCHVVLLEAVKFPRYHIGESMLPSMRNFLRFIDFLDEFEAYGFRHKKGAAFKFGLEKRTGFTNFCEEDKTNHAWNVVRSESDHLLLKYASRCGVKVFEETRVTEIEFDGVRPFAAHYKQVNGSTGKIYFDYLVDSSGRNAVVSSKYLKNRIFNPSFKNVAAWGYWTGVNAYNPKDEVQADSPFFQSLTDESGWAWFIPLHNGTTSVGVVTDQDSATRKKAELGSSGNREFYLSELKRAPIILELIGEGKLVLSDQPNMTVKMASDYSYTATSYAGSHYRLVGDAACFIDPFFSSGVHLALSGGLSAAATILASINGTCSEAQASSWHDHRIDTSYTRFLVVVLAAYRQICDQKAPIISDISEDGFDRAFSHFRTIIQGRVDVQQQLQDAAPNLRETMEFCKRAFDVRRGDAPTVASPPSQAGTEEEESVPQLHASQAEASGSLLQSEFNFARTQSDAASAAEKIDKSVAKFDMASKSAIVDAHTGRFYASGDPLMIDDVISDSFGGLKLRLEKGGLGLVRA